MSDPTASLLSLAGRVALVTGASSGLGRHFASTLAGAGARVIIGARRVEVLESVAAGIRAAGGTVAAVAMDVTDEASVEAAFDEAERAFGPADVLVNNAGIAHIEPSAGMSTTSFDAVVDTNLRGAFLVARAGARRMIEHSVRGSIINIASITAFRVAGGLGAYGAAKAGLVQLTRTMGMELAREGVRVNAIAPGYILTEMNRAFFSSPPGQKMIARIPQRRIGDPSDLDGALLLLASERASGFMTGSVITVDGGHLHSSL